MQHYVCNMNKLIIITLIAIAGLSSCTTQKENKMEKVIIDEIKVIGISVRTTNENSKVAEDIPQLWNRFMSENIAAKIPNKAGDEIYSIYTDYEGDYMKPYTTILACQVSSFDDVPEGMVAKTIGGGNYKKYVAKGSLKENIVYNTWLKIWEDKIDRAYTSDFEVYGAKAQNPEDAEIDIFVSLK